MADAMSERAVIWGTAQDGRRDGRELVVMMHGRGGKESDLFGLARFFLPEATVVASLRAPRPQGNGFAWYSGSSASELEASVTGVLDWLDTLSFTPSSIALMGFSQGARMALQLARQAPGRFRYALQLSGTVSEDAQPAMRRSRQRSLASRCSGAAAMRMTRSPRSHSSAPGNGSALTRPRRSTCTQWDTPSPRTSCAT